MRVDCVFSDTTPVDGRDAPDAGAEIQI